MNRRDWLKRTAAGAVVGGLALSNPPAQANDQQNTDRQSDHKLSGTEVFTTACNFCSCGCGMVCYVKDGKLIDLEGDPGHIVNEGALCSKGAAMIAAHESPRRLREPLYRAPGSERWQTISWNEALDKVARKMKETRDGTWIEKEIVKDASGKSVEYKVNRTDAIGFLGGAQNTNEECYLISKMLRVLGTVQVEHQARL
jgi:formate dehydrogenase major subunit